MKDKSVIFKLNQTIKKSKYSVKEIAKEAGLTESQLRTYMNTRVPPLEQYSALIEAFKKLREIELAEQLILQLVGLNWCFYYTGKNNNFEPDPNKIFRDLSVLIGEVNKVFENIGNLDKYDKMIAMVHLQKTISILHDLMRLIDREGNFLRLWK